MSFFYFLFWTLFFANIPESQPPKSEFCCTDDVLLGEEFEGKASYYGVRFHGKKTASGEIMDKEDFTCAHPLYPFGTMIEVTNTRNGKKVIVRVNDRGPYTPKRVLDISVAAAQKIEMTSAGIQNIKGMVVGCCGEIYISTNPASTESDSLQNNN